jgi:hypothetical protein
MQKEASWMKLDSSIGEKVLGIKLHKVNAVAEEAVTTALVSVVTIYSRR